MPAEKINHGNIIASTNPKIREAPKEIGTPINLPANMDPIANKSIGIKKPSNNKPKLVNPNHQIYYYSRVKIGEKGVKKIAIFAFSPNN